MKMTVAWSAPSFLSLKISAMLHRICSFALVLAFLPLTATAQQSASTRPTVGLREAGPSPILLQGGDVVVSPDAEPTKLDVLIDGTQIMQVGTAIVPPAGTERRDITGKRVYAGLIDAMHDVELPEQTTTDSAEHWNANVTPQYRAAWSADKTQKDTDKRRGQGITAQLLAPKDGIVKGSSCVVLLVDPNDPNRLLSGDVFQHATLTVPRGKSRDRYPNSPMGATALLRQSIYDAIWYRDANRHHLIRSTSPKPEPNTAMQTLSDAVASGTIVIDAANERMAERAIAIADEFSLRMVMRGSGREYRSLDAIAKSGKTILLPIDFPDAPKASTSSAIRDTPLVDWMHWHFAPENPSRLDAAGVRFAFTTDGMDDPTKFLKQIRIAVDRGLDPAVALAAVTTTPAELLRIESTVGQVKAGMMANLVIVDGDLFDDETKVVETWIAGQRFAIEEESPNSSDALVGNWNLNLPTKGGSKPALLRIEKKGKDAFRKN